MRVMCKGAVFLLLLGSCVAADARALEGLGASRQETTGVRAMERAGQSGDPRALALAEQAPGEGSGGRILKLAQRLEAEAGRQRIDELTRRSELQAERQRWLLMVIGGGALLLLTTGVLVLRLRQSREEIRRFNVGLEQRVEAQTAELRQQASYLRTLIDTLPVSVWLKDMQGRYRTINVAINGHPTAEVIGRTDEELWPGDIGRTLRASDLEVIATRRRVNVELPIPDHGGTPVWYEIDKAPVIDEDGKLLGIVGVSRNINERKEAERRLKEALEFSEGVINAIPDLLFEVDRDGRYLEVWAQDPELLAAQKEALIGRTVHEVLSPEGAAAAIAAIREADETGRAHGKTIWIDLPSGRRWFEHSLSKMQGGSPAGATFLVLSRDITERKEAEQKLQDALELVEGVISAIPDLLFEVDRDGRYLNVWTHTPELLAAQKEALLGNTVRDSLPPASAATVMEALREAEAKELSFGKVIRIDLPQGTRCFELSVSRKPGGSPADVRFLILSRDVTERLQMEADLAARERELTALAESSPGMMGSFHLKPDGSTCMPYVSPNIFELFGLRPSDVAEDATPLLNASHPDDARRVMDSILESARTMTPWRQEYRVLHPTKGERWMEGHTNPQPHPDGGVIWYGYVLDITEFKRSEAAREAALAEARRLAHARSEFLAQMSHELRTPLNGILGYAQILGRDGGLTQHQKSQVGVIRQSGEHLLTLINDILDFARSDAGRMELHPTKVSTERLLNTIVGIVRVKAEEKGLRLDTDFAPEVPSWIRIDEKRLRQVLLNLLSNAVKFTERGAVGLRVDLVGPARLRFEVTDTGVGIAPEQIGAIFRPFEQVGEHRHRFGGTGLGLSISRALVRLMGGDIEVSSTPGEGSVFRFEIECIAETAPASATVTAPVIAGYAGPRKTLLVVDDVPGNRAIAMDMLAPLGFDLVEAGDGEEALEKAKRVHPDLILMDIVMPKVDGLEATRRLRNTPGRESTPVIVVSAGLSGEGEAESIRAGANAFLPKPLELPDLLAEIGRQLGIQWRADSAEAESAAAGPIVAPPADQLDALLQLAEMGDMRNIVAASERLAESDARYRGFSDHLRELAGGYQSRAVLAFIQRYRDSGAS